MSEFSPDTWKEKLTQEQIGTVEDACEEFMNRTGYEKWTKPAAQTNASSKAVIEAKPAAVAQQQVNRTV